MRNGAVSEIASASRHPYIPMDTCTYCDAPTDDLVTADDVDGVFCCSGCLEAHRVAEEQTETTTTPAATTAMDTTTIMERTRRRSKRPSSTFAACTAPAARTSSRRSPRRRKHRLLATVPERLPV